MNTHRVDISVDYPKTIEDAFRISHDASRRLNHVKIDVSVIDTGRERVALNLH